MNLTLGSTQTCQGHHHDKFPRPVLTHRLTQQLFKETTITINNNNAEQHNRKQGGIISASYYVFNHKVKLGLLHPEVMKGYGLV
jgi:hypothetical protein